MSTNRAAAGRSRSRVAAAVAATLIGSLLPTLPLAVSAAAAGVPKPAAPSPGKVVKVTDAKTKARKADTTVSAPAAQHTAWPKAGSAHVALSRSGGPAAKADGLPVTLTPTASGVVSPKAATGSAAGQGQAEVKVLDQDAARRAGVTGVLLSLSGPAGPAAAKAKVSLDYSAFAQAAGAGFGARLHLVQLPACALTTPAKAECRVQTPLKGANDAEKQTVSADDVTLAAPAAPTPTASAPAGGARAMAASNGVTVLAATAGTAGPSGDYKASPLSSSSTWSTSLNSGSFSWSYDMPLTAMPGGLTPKLGLSYDSGSVDGRTSNANNQASWAGDGFTLDPGFVERTYKPCEDDGAPKSNGYPPGDQCWATDNANISFAGHSGELIPVSADEWRIKGDDNTKVVRVRDTGRGNGDNDGEYFKATTSDGTSYFFGYNRLPNWAAGKPETKSVYTVPVFGNDSGEPCYSSGGFASSWCQQGWRWNLDLVVDSHGNDITYWYTPETNNYGRNLKATDRTPYVRGGHLDHVEYGQQQGDIYSATVKPMARVDFKTAERCLETTASLCDPANIDTNRQYWYDTPWDQNCKDGTDCTGVYSPSFFTRTRLTQVAAGTLQGDGSYKTVDTWDLTHAWGTSDYDYQLLLKSVLHTGTAATPSVALPATTFAYKQLVNRMDRPGDGRLPFIKQRLGTITDELGGQIDVNYSGAACDASNLPTPQTNTTRCFPQQYQPNNDVPVTTEWFNKYVVDSVIATDRTGGAPDAVTRYTYLDDAAWHFDDLDGISKEKLKTWSQWRGYGHVRVETGGNSGMSTQAEHYFLRGMDGDRSDPADKTKKRSVSVDDGLGNPITDDQAWAGFEYRSEQFDQPGGKILSKTVSTPWKRTTATRVRDWGTTTANMTGTASARSFTSLDNGKGASWRETRTNTTFDDSGRATVTENLGDVSVDADDRCTTTTFVDNTTAWIFTGAVRTETVAAKCGATVDRTTRADGSSAVLADSRVRFDGQAYGAAPTKGDPTVTETLQNRSATTATYLDGTASYDVYGRRTAVTDFASTTAFDNTTNTPTGTVARPEARTTTTAYTPATGRPTRQVVTSPPAKAGDGTTTQATTIDFDALRGQAVDTLDANGLRTDVSVDALGRTLKVWLPNQPKASYPNSPNHEYAYALTDGKITAVTTKTLNNDNSQDTSYTLYDGFGRVREVQGPGDNGGRTVADTFYDERGQAVLAYAPYHAAGAPSTTLLKVEDTTEVETQTAVSYDGLGRIVKSTVLGGNGPGTPLATTVTEYGGDRVTVTPPKGGTPTTTISDAAGRTTELRQYKAATPTGAFDSTSYAYDPAGRMTGLTDPSGTAWTWGYDQLGRPTKAVDPDSGTTTKTYNVRGDLVSTTDGRGKTLTTVYDNLSRPIETHDGTATGPLLTNQVWDPANNKGQLASTSRFTTVGGTSYEYKTAYSLFDKLYRPGRTTTTVPSVPGREGLAGSYTSSVIYGLDGLPKSIGYPAAGNLAGETVVFTYDSLHRQTKASGASTYLTLQTYDFVGKPLQSTLSNGTANKDLYVTNAYESGTQRLKSSRTDQFGIATPARAAQYTYDEVGNVTSVADTSASGTDRQCFQYDYLARLTEAFTPTAGSCPASPTGTALGGPAAYWTSWTYNTNGTRASETQHDPAGNTAQDTTTAYSYPQPTAAQPHTLSGTSTVTGAVGPAVLQSYSYDLTGETTDRHLKPSGNQTSDQKLTWDDEGHLGKVVDTVKTTSGGTTTTTSKTSDYLYDAGGNRFLAHLLDTANPAAENWTLYLGTTEVNLVKGAAKATATRYYPLGAATAVRTDDNTVAFQVNDHHGTAELNVNATTGAVDQRRTTPFGQTRGTNPTGWAGTRGFLGGTNEPTGLTHLGARDYDPATGRFTSIDPVLAPADPQSLAGYTYSGNNPLTFSDPSGLMRVEGSDGGSDGTLPSGSNGEVPCQESSACRDWQKDEQDKFKKSVEDLKKKWYDYNHKLICKSIVSTSACATQHDWDEVQGMGKNLAKFVSDATLLIPAIRCTMGGGSGGKHSDDCDTLGLAMSSDDLGVVARDGSLLLSSIEKDALRACLRSKHSFPADTPVLMADGSSKPIQDIRVGDQVLNSEPGADGRQKHTVDAVMVTTDDVNFVDLTVKGSAGDSTITATANHPIYSVSRHAWIDAGNIVAGELVQSTDKKTAKIVSARSRRIPQVTYDLTIDGVHTYYVLAGSTPVLVHNIGCGPSTIVLGVDGDNLAELAAERKFGNDSGAVSFHDYSDGFGGAGPAGDYTDFFNHFRAALKPGSGTSLVFDLRDVEGGSAGAREWADSMRASDLAGNPSDQFTGWELGQIKAAPKSVRDSITWVGGPNPFADLP